MKKSVQFIGKLIKIAITIKVSEIRVKNWKIDKIVYIEQHRKLNEATAKLGTNTGTINVDRK